MRFSTKISTERSIYINLGLESPPGRVPKISLFHQGYPLPFINPPPWTVLVKVILLQSYNFIISSKFPSYGQVYKSKEANNVPSN